MTQSSLSFILLAAVSEMPKAVTWTAHSPLTTDFSTRSPHSAPRRCDIISYPLRNYNQGDSTMRDSQLRLLLKGFVLSIIALCGACGSGGGDNSAAPPVVQEPTPKLLSFALRAQDNSELDSDLSFVIDGAAVTGRLPTNSPVTGLVAAFEFEGETVALDGVTQTSAQQPNDFTQPVSLTVTNRSGDIANYTVDIMKFTGLPIIYLNTEGGVSIESKEIYVPGTIRVDGWRLYDSIPEVTMEIRGRGHSTWFLHPKKPYQMKLSDSSEFLGMLDNRKWLFLA
ncbi:MAG: hypothetical protein OEM51_12300, partial [Gammaproteobacteria bacterium]|nr:hypothetical protein [Gammaproteobacteria bacterium]